jgi:hypothetical protein
MLSRITWRLKANTKDLLMVVFFVSTRGYDESWKGSSFSLSAHFPSVSYSSMQSTNNESEDNTRPISMD